ncbi:hypothetical protein LXL04_014909 [Taraxacum kok-saghyz]
MINGMEHLVGCFEIDDGWTPFSLASFPDSESEDEEDIFDGEEEEGVPDSFNDIDMEAEEGEFFPDGGNYTGK